MFAAGIYALPVVCLVEAIFVNGKQSFTPPIPQPVSPHGMIVTACCISCFTGT